MLRKKLEHFTIILGSQSPRRKELLASIDVKFEVIVRNVEEIYPPKLSNVEIVKYLAKLKADAFLPTKNELIITADTIVCLDNEILEKPKDIAHAKDMLHLLSGKSHEVITGVTLKSNTKEIVFADTTKVTFKKLSNEEIEYYAINYSPLDKAGAYGVQEWIGQIGITTIEGSYFTVMGLPTHRVYEELLKF